MKSIREFISNVQNNVSKNPISNPVSNSVTPIFSKNYTNKASTFSVDKSGISRIAAYVISIIIIILVILLFVHFFIKPIFSLHPGSPGLITIPGFDDGVLFWSKTNSSLIQNKDLPISQLSNNYSINLDMFIQNPYQFSNYPRILFSRGGEYKDKPTGDTPLGVLSNYNLAIALKSDINDLIVSVLNKDNHMENVIIPNIPVQEPFRVGIIVMELALEVYLNGRLVKTRSFRAPPKDVKGDITPAKGAESNIAKLRNLKIWSRILTTSEVRYAKPSLSSEKQFGAGPMPTSSTCSDRSEKLSASTDSISASTDDISSLHLSDISSNM